MYCSNGIFLVLVTENRPFEVSFSKNIRKTVDDKTKEDYCFLNIVLRIVLFTVFFNQSSISLYSPDVYLKGSLSSVKILNKYTRTQ